MKVSFDLPGLSALLLLAVVMLLITACAGTDFSPDYDASVNASRGGYLSIFLNLKEDNSPPVQMNIESIEVLADSGDWLSLALDSKTINAKAIANNQIFLARAYLPAGYYSRIRLTLKSSFLYQQEGTVALNIAQSLPDFPIPTPLYINSGDSHSLFLAWDVRASMQNNLSFNPLLNVAPKITNLIADAAYVSCPEINTVFMVRTDKNWVYDSLGVSDGPVYLFSSPVAPEENLFALTGSKPGVKRIGPSINRIVENYSLPMISSATHMALAPDGRRAYVIDRQRGTVMRVNLLNGHVEKRVRLGYGPSYIIYLEPLNLLAVAQPLAQSVVLLDPETLTTVRSIPTGSRPEGMALLNDMLLYIAESGANSVMVYDLKQNRIKKRVPVDFTPMRILVAKGYVYISNYGSMNISILRPGQLGVSRSISLSGAPLEMAAVRTSRWIYVGNEGNNSVTVIDPATSRIVSHIFLGARPGGIAVINR